MGDPCREGEGNADLPHLHGMLKGVRDITFTCKLTFSDITQLDELQSNH